MKTKSHWKYITVPLLAGTALLAACHHAEKERVVVVQQPAPAPQPETKTVVIEHDRPAAPQTPIVVHEAPPPPRPDAPPPEPAAPDQAWVAGHWEYQNNSYTWAAGHFITKPQPNATYVSPHWENRADGWTYVAGYWSSSSPGR